MKVKDSFRGGVSVNFYTKTDKIILLINKIILGFLVFVILLPLLYILLASFLEPGILVTRGIFDLKVSDFTLEGYRTVLQDNSIVRGFINSLIYSSVSALLVVFFSVITAYPLSIEGFVGKKVIMVFFLITMFIGGGLIPTFLLIRNLGLLNTMWALVLPGALGVFNVILVKTFFQAIPKEIQDAAKMDGASHFQVFLKIMLPLSKSIMFVLALYAFVGQWNSFFDAMIYLDDATMQPLQLVLRSILIQNEVQPGMIADQAAMIEMNRLAEMIKYSTIVISTLPLLIMYPFFQKYFEKGVIVGSLK